MQDVFKMNKSYEFVGTLEYNPLSKEDREARNQFFSENGYMPTNVIPDMDKYPVLHVMAYLDHPYKNATKYRQDGSMLDSARILELRNKLMEILIELLGGDELAAEYILFTLLSKVQKREDGLPIGVF